MYHALPPLTVAYYAFWSGLPMANTGEAYIREGRAVIALPTHDDQTLVSVQWPHREFSDIRTDIGGNFMRSLELAPGLAARVHAARRESRFAGAAICPTSSEGRLVLEGARRRRRLPPRPCPWTWDSDAFRDAELLATAIDAGLENRTPMNEALADYQRLRDSQARPLYELISSLPGSNRLHLSSGISWGSLRIDLTRSTGSSRRPLARFPSLMFSAQRTSPTRWGLRHSDAHNLEADPPIVRAAPVCPLRRWRFVFPPKGLETGSGFDQRAIDAEVLVAQQVQSIRLQQTSRAAMERAAILVAFDAF